MKKAKIGVIGAGWWATEFHIPHLKERDENIGFPFLLPIMMHLD